MMNWNVLIPIFFDSPKLAAQRPFSALRGVLFILIFFMLVACQKSDEQAAAPTVPQYTYTFQEVGCETGVHSFSSFETFCQQLKDEKANKSCAQKKREDLFRDSKCAQATQTKPIFTKTDLIDPEKIPAHSFGVDLRDIIAYKTGLKSLAQTVIQNLQENPEWYVPGGVSFIMAGPGFEPTTRVNAIFGIEFTKLILDSEQKITGAVLSIFYHSKTMGVRVRHMKFQLDEEQKISSVVFLQELTARNIQFKLEVSLSGRKLIVRAEDQGIFKIFPLGVGGFDEGVEAPGTRLLTHTIPQAIVDPRKMASEVYDPEYFMGRPFIVIGDQTGRKTGFGFHYSITTRLLRGFVSHGCMRMADKDLYELYTLLSHNRQKIDLAMLMTSSFEYDHPYPLINDRYGRVKNFGTKAAPEIRRDEEGLSIMETVRGKPPLDKMGVIQ
ncbi:MAG: L,D-transpeptidase [Bdellovibrionales bacterium]